MKKLQYMIVKLIRAVGGRWIIKALNSALRSITAFCHWIQFAIEWGASPRPEWFDHFLDQQLWSRIPLAWERGVFNLLAIPQNSRVLELCCGDGFNAYHFYSIRASHVTSVDFDPKAISHARRFNSAPNVTFLQCDIRTELPDGGYDNILWDAAIEHFTEAEINSIMKAIKPRLTAHGILSGYTLVEQPDGKSHEEHEYEFKSKEDLMRFLLPYFKNVMVFETIYPTRHNLYFYASDSTIPFDPAWPNKIKAATA